ncbi:MAG: hypothetical protein NTY77_20030 [Elusimicrobia bacterium]|nr:hypothetical protein [Elusimicrobiota bacterium]
MRTILRSRPLAALLAACLLPSPAGAGALALRAAPAKASPGILTIPAGDLIHPATFVSSLGYPAVTTRFGLTAGLSAPAAPRILGPALPALPTAPVLAAPSDSPLPVAPAAAVGPRTAQQRVSDVARDIAPDLARIADGARQSPSAARESAGRVMSRLLAAPEDAGSGDAAPVFSRRSGNWRQDWAQLLKERYPQWSRLPGFSVNWYHQTEGPYMLKVKVLRRDRFGNAAFLNGLRPDTYKVIDLRVVPEGKDLRLLAFIQSRGDMLSFDTRASYMKGSIQFVRGDSWPTLGVSEASLMRRWQEAAGLYSVPEEFRARIARSVAGTPFDTDRDAALRAASPALKPAPDRRPRWRRDWAGFLRENLAAWRRMPEFSSNWYHEIAGPYPLHMTILSRDRDGGPAFLNGMSPRAYRVIDLKMKQDAKGLRLLAVVRDGWGRLRFLDTRPEYLKGAISFSRGSWPSLAVSDAYRMLQWQKKAGLYEVPKRYRDAIDPYPF